jgi:hypothetical protein
MGKSLLGYFAGRTSPGALDILGDLVSQKLQIDI